MPLHVRADNGLVILSNFGRLLNDPRHFDAGRDVADLLDQGYRHFILELAGIRELGSTALGLLTTLTRLVRREGGELVLAHLSPVATALVEEMKMDAYWDVFESVEEATQFFQRTPA